MVENTVVVCFIQSSPTASKSFGQSLYSALFITSIINTEVSSFYSTSIKSLSMKLLIYEKAS
jgi:hypothetical protein